jgi:competence protein ComEC
MVTAMERLPGLAFDLRPFGVGWVILCYVVLAVVLLRRRLPWGRVWLALSVVILAGVTIYSQRPAPPPQSAELNLLAVGGGQCAVLRVPSGETFIIDAGTRSGFDAYSQTIAPFLRAQRLPSPRTAFISHPNTDHFNALPSYMARRGLDRAYLGRSFSAAFLEPDTALTASELMRQFKSRGVEVVSLVAGDRLKLDDRTSLEVLWPPADKVQASANKSSLVLRITCEGWSVLIPGDIEQDGQKSLAMTGAAISADVLVLPHHGAWRESLPGFITAVAPKYVLASSTREPDGPPAQEEPQQFYDSLKERCRFYSTPRNGWIQVRFGNAGVEVQTMR